MKGYIESDINSTVRKAIAEFQNNTISHNRYMQWQQFSQDEQCILLQIFYPTYPYAYVKDVTFSAIMAYLGVALLPKWTSMSYSEKQSKLNSHTQKLLLYVFLLILVNVSLIYSIIYFELYSWIFTNIIVIGVCLTWTVIHIFKMLSTARQCVLLLNRLESQNNRILDEFSE
jgi:hypothetical protein